MKEPPLCCPPGRVLIPIQTSKAVPAPGVLLDKGRHEHMWTADGRPPADKGVRGTHLSPARHPVLLLLCLRRSQAQDTKFSRPRLLEAAVAAKAETGGRGTQSRGVGGLGEQGRQGG